MRVSNLGPLIAALSPCLLSFTAGYCFSHVVAAVFGSGVITAVLLPIFAVFIITLVSATYRINWLFLNKKEASPSKEEHDQQTEPTKELAEKLVHENLESKSIEKEPNNQQCSASQGQTEESVHESEPIGEGKFNKPVKKASEPRTEGDKPSMPAPTPPPVTLGAQPSASVPPPPPPPPGFLNSSTKPNGTGLLTGIGSVKLKKASGSDKGQSSANADDPQKSFIDELKSKSNAKQGSGEKIAARIEKQQKERRAQQALEEKRGNSFMNHSMLTKKDGERITSRQRITQYSDSESEHSGSDNDSGWSTDEEKGKQKEAEQKKKVLKKYSERPTLSNPPSDNGRRSESPDSGHGSDDGATTPPLHSAPKAGKPEVPPKPADLQTRLQAPLAVHAGNVDLVNSKQDQPPPTNSVKNLTAAWESRR